MPNPLRTSSLIFAACLILAGSTPVNIAAAQTKPASRPSYRKLSHSHAQRHLGPASSSL
jgi:hypothetical protein